METLTPFASAERYGSETPLTLDRDQALAWAAAAIAWARGIIEPKPPQPPTEPEETDTPIRPD